MVISPFYDAVMWHSPNADVVIPPRATAVVSDKSAPQCNQNIAEIEAMGRIQWQKEREYGRRNYSELGVEWFQNMHAREFSRQEQEALIASGALKKINSLGIAKSRLSA